MNEKNRSHLLRPCAATRLLNELVSKVVGQGAPPQTTKQLLPEFGLRVSCRVPASIVVALLIVVVEMRNGYAPKWMTCGQGPLQRSVMGGGGSTGRSLPLVGTESLTPDAAGYIRPVCAPTLSASSPDLYAEAVGTCGVGLSDFGQRRASRIVEVRRCRRTANDPIESVAQGGEKLLV